jgi:hypothetical protein
VNLPVPLAQLIRLFEAPGVHARVLMGNYARGEAGSYSDIDVVRFTEETHLPGAVSNLMGGHLVVASDVTPTGAGRALVQRAKGSDRYDHGHT